MRAQAAKSQYAPVSLPTSTLPVTLHKAKGGVSGRAIDKKHGALPRMLNTPNESLNLGQYFNQGGQIVNGAPDLATREFYRDAICRHRFNEMYTGCQPSIPLSYFATADKIVATFGDYQGGTPPTIVRNGGNLSPGYDIVAGPNGGDAMSLSYNGDVTPKTLSVYFRPITPINLSGGDIRFRSIIKSPLLLESSPGSGTIRTSFNSETVYANFPIFSYGPGGSITADVPNIMYKDVDESVVNASFDGSWHVYDTIIRMNAKTQFFIDGATILEQDTSAYYNGVCDLDTVGLYISTNTEDINFSIQSITVERI